MLLLNNYPPPTILTQQATNQSVSNPQDKYVLNVFFHRVRNANGTNTDYTGNNYSNEFGEVQILDAVRLLNTNFNSHNIFFKYQGFDVIYNDNLNNNALSSGYPNLKPNAMNFYFVDLIGNNYGGVAFRGNIWAKYTYTALEQNFEKTFIHEVGHCLHLLHTFNSTDTCEHVARSGPDFNADVSGDFIVDTPADPGPLSAPYFTNCVFNYGYNPSLVDCIGTPYANVMSSNYMGYSNIPGCSPFFTEGQFQWMRNYLATPGTIMDIQNIDNTVESLYKPFESTNVETNIVSTTDNNDGTLRVCRNYYSGNYRFQPGFDYVFPENSGSDPVNASVNVTPLVVNPPFNCPLIIQQISPTFVGQAETVCRGIVCVDEPLVSGIKYSTQVLGAMNVTIEYLNEIEVKDPNLFETLMSQYYHILKKYTNSGASVETVIYKN